MKDTTLRNRREGWLPSLSTAFGALISLFGLVTIVSWYIAEGTFQQKTLSVLTTGKIIKITVTETKTDDETITTCTPTIRFFTRQKQAIEFSPTVTTSDDCHRQVGDVVNVAYHADNPEEAQVIPSGGPWLGNLPDLIVGGVICLLLFVVCVSIFIGTIK